MNGWDQIFEGKGECAGGRGGGERDTWGNSLVKQISEVPITPGGNVAMSESSWTFIDAVQWTQDFEVCQVAYTQANRIVQAWMYNQQISDKPVTEIDDICTFPSSKMVLKRYKFRFWASKFALQNKSASWENLPTAQKKCALRADNNTIEPVSKLTEMYQAYP